MGNEKVETKPAAKKIDEIIENRLGVSQVGEEFIATRHVVESYSAQRLVSMVEAFDKRIAQRGAEIEAMMEELGTWQKSRKDWESAYQRAKNILLKPTEVVTDGGSKENSGTSG